jgi:hypothetical protein
MPPYFAAPYFHLSRLPLSTKVALTCFYLAVLTALAFSAFVVFGERTRWRVREVQANFAGDERVTRETGAGLERMHAEPSPRALYDVVHPHSLVMPVLYFILVHLMEMSAGPRGLRIALYLFSFAAMMTTIFAPLLVAAALGWAGVVMAAVAGMLVSFAAMILVPAWQMWAGAGRREGA